MNLSIQPRKELFCEETEQALLGTLLVNPDAFELVGGLQGAHLSSGVHHRIFETLRELYSLGKQPPIQQIARMFDNDTDLSLVGGGQYILDLAECPGDTVSTKHRAIYLSGLYQLRKAREHAAKVIEVAESFQPGADPLELRADLERAIQEWDTGDEAKNEKRVGDWIEDLRRNRATPQPRILSGITALDARLKGFFNGQLIIIAARPSVGKSALAATLSYNIASKGNPSFYVSLEMRAEENLNRILSRLLGQDLHGDPDAYKQVDPERLRKAEEHIKSLPIVMNDAAGQGVSTLISRIRHNKRKNGARIAFVDQLSHIQSNDTKQAKTYQIEETTRALKQLAKELDIPIVLFCQLRRPPTGAENRRPGMSDLKDSGAIEQDADTVILIHREECAEFDAGSGETQGAFKGTARTKQQDAAAYADKEAAKGQAELIIAKARQGTRGTAYVKFNGERQHFHD